MINAKFADDVVGGVATMPMFLSPACGHVVAVSAAAAAAAAD